MINKADCWTVGDGYGTYVEPTWTMKMGGGMNEMIIINCLKLTNFK
jgi:hypothetical protein